MHPRDMITLELPPRDEMLAAFLGSDAAYDGVFVTAVRSTGIFCRPSCPARKPRPDRVEFFATPRDAVLAGFRPCRRCTPLELPGETPPWLRPVLEKIEDEPTRRWTDGDLRELGLSPERVRRWFQRHHGMTFHAYSRARRLGAALGRIRGGGSVLDSAFELGYESPAAFAEAFRRVFGMPPGRAGAVEEVHVDRLLTPLGPMLAAAGGDGLCLLEFADRRMLERQLRRLGRRIGAVPVPGPNAVLDQAAAELEEYFAGSRREFTIPLRPAGSELQLAVWSALRAVPFGATLSYGELARRVSRPTAVRAVAGAVGSNPVAIVVPCHRIVGADGSLTGYGGGLWRKRKLLEHEQGLRVSGLFDAGPGEVARDFGLEAP